MQDDDLLPGAHRLEERVAHGRRERPVFRGFAAQIDQGDLRQPGLADPTLQAFEGYPPVPGRMEDLHVRRGRTHEQQATTTGNPPIGQLPCLVDQPLILLEGCVVLLVEDDQPRLQGQEQAGTGADDNAGSLPTGHLHERPVAFCRAQVPMEKANVRLRQGATHVGMQLQGDGDFRSQEHDMEALPQGAPGQLQVHGRLPAPGHPEQQGRLRCPFKTQRPETLHGPDLLWRQANTLPLRSIRPFRLELGLHLPDQPLAQERPEGLGEIPAEMGQQLLR